MSTDTEVVHRPEDRFCEPLVDRQFAGQWPEDQAGQSTGDPR